MNAQTELFTGKQRRDAGIKKAEDHAGGAWNIMADAAFDWFISKRQTDFMTEDFRLIANHLFGLPNPPSLRAFGGVILRAARAGKIVRVGYGQVKNPKANSANASVWRKA